HPMHVFTTLDRSATHLESIHELAGKALFHALFGALTSEFDDPTGRKRLTTGRTNFHRNLVVRTTHTAAFYFHVRFHIVDGFLEDLKRIIIHFFLNDIKRSV